MLCIHGSQHVLKVATCTSYCTELANEELMQSQREANSYTIAGLVHEVYNVQTFPLKSTYSSFNITIISGQHKK